MYKSNKQSKMKKELRISKALIIGSIVLVNTTLILVAVLTGNVN